MYAGLYVDTVSRETLLKIQDAVSEIMDSEQCLAVNYKCARCPMRYECDSLADFAMQIDKSIERRDLLMEEF